MNRRTFTRTAMLGLAAMAFHSYGHLMPTTAIERKSFYPPLLKKGDTIGLISPGSYISDEGLEKAVNNIEALGFHVKMGKNIRKKRGFTAGTDAERLADLHAMYADKQVQAIWCVRGGYGSARLLPLLDFKLIKKHPKALIGYSDITALLNAIYRKTGLIGFHGPVASSELTTYNREYLLSVLMKRPKEMLIRGFRQMPAEADETTSFHCLLCGKAEGRLIGGNLTLLASMAGTPWSPEYRNKIVLIEDVGEKPYRIDRMLTQLRQATDIDRAAGFALGTFADCEADKEDSSLSLLETLRDNLLRFGKPTAYGLSFGHIKNQCTLPIGLPALFDAKEGTLKLL